MNTEEISWLALTLSRQDTEGSSSNLGWKQLKFFIKTSSIRLFFLCLKQNIRDNFLKVHVVCLWHWDVSRGFYKGILFYCYGENERTANMRLYPNSVHLSGENIGPDSQLIESTLMYISWYPFKFSTICSHCVSSITTSLMLTRKGRQCYVFLPTFHIYLRTLLFTRMEAPPKKAYGGPAVILMGSFISERKIFTEERECQPHR